MIFDVPKWGFDLEKMWFYVYIIYIYHQPKCHKSPAKFVSFVERASWEFNRDTFNQRQFGDQPWDWFFRVKRGCGDGSKVPGRQFWATHRSEFLHLCKWREVCGGVLKWEDTYGYPKSSKSSTRLVYVRHRFGDPHFKKSHLAPALLQRRRRHRKTCWRRSLTSRSKEQTWTKKRRSPARAWKLSRRFSSDWRRPWKSSMMKVWLGYCRLALQRDSLRVGTVFLSFAAELRQPGFWEILWGATSQFFALGD